MSYVFCPICLRLFYSVCFSNVLYSYGPETLLPEINMDGWVVVLRCICAYRKMLGIKMVFVTFWGRWDRRSRQRTNLWVTVPLTPPLPWLGYVPVE